MTTEDRYLHFDNIDLGEPEISSQCSQCGREFKASPKVGIGQSTPSFRVTWTQSRGCCAKIRV